MKMEANCVSELLVERFGPGPANCSRSRGVPTSPFLKLRQVHISLVVMRFDYWSVEGRLKGNVGLRFPVWHDVVVRVFRSVVVQVSVSGVGRSTAHLIENQRCTEFEQANGALLMPPRNKDGKTGKEGRKVV